MRALLFTVAIAVAVQQQTPVRFGGAFSGLEPSRQLLVNNWVARLVAITGQNVDAGPFYDEILTVSTKTTFDAVTHALMTTSLTDGSGASLGNALALVHEVDTVRGEIARARGDHQFRMYVRLTPAALEILDRSQQFKRVADNTVYHKGYPINYREQGGVPSIQISVALDRVRADIDVDYRSSDFPKALLNGHLTSSNSDVRAGNNFDRHLNRWAGFENWWRSFFGVRLSTEPQGATKSELSIPRFPRAGKKDIDVMVHDFLQAWLVEGDVVAAMAYVSERSFACLAQDLENPGDFDRGMAPFQLMMRMKAARDALGPPRPLDDLLVPVHLPIPALKAVRQSYVSEFVVYSVPDDLAMQFDCESRLIASDAKKPKRAYGTYSGATFHIADRRDEPVALLWAKQDGYWKIVSWHVGNDAATTPPPDEPADVTIPRIPADETLVTAARGFLDSWLMRKDYDAAFAYVSPAVYACYDIARNPAAPPATSLEDAGRRIRAGLESAGKSLNNARELGDLLSSAEPTHPLTRIMDERDAAIFSLASIPDALADAMGCVARARNDPIPDPIPPVYGNAFGMLTRFHTREGDAPVLRVIWRKEAGQWRITAYDIDVP